jgi:hypothetical protein
MKMKCCNKNKKLKDCSTDIFFRASSCFIQLDDWITGKIMQQFLKKIGMLLVCIDYQ